MKKKWIYILSTILLVTIGIYLYLKYRKLDDFEPILKNKLKQIVKKGTNNLYNLELDKLEADILNSRLILTNVYVTPDSLIIKSLEQIKKAPNDVFKIHLQTLVIEGINIDDFLSKNKFNLDVLAIKNPEVEVYHTQRTYNQPTTKDSISLYQRIAKQVNQIDIKEIIIADASIKYHNRSKNKINNFNHINIHFTNLLIDSLTQYDSTRFLYAKDASITIKNYQIRTPDSLYICKIDSIHIAARQRLMTLLNISVNPRGSKGNFEKKLSYVQDRYDLKINTLKFENIDWWSLANEDGIWSKKAELFDGALNVYCDRSLPPSPKSKLGNYPHQLLMKLKLPMYINELLIHHLNISYEEFNPKSEQKGKIYFDNVNGVVSNITNMADQIHDNKWMKVIGSTKLMHTALLKATFNFDLIKYKQGVFSIDATLGKLDGKILNPVTKPLGLFEIKEGTINKLEAHINGNNLNATGKILLLYENLKINAFKKDEDKKGAIKKRGFISFIANNFIIAKSNPSKGNILIHASAFYQRDIHKSFFNLIWKTILTGITNTIKGKS